MNTPLPLLSSLRSSSELPQSVMKTITELQQGNSIKDIQSDYEKVRQFLLNYRGSEATFNSYRREMERLLQWLWFKAKKSLREVKRDDIEKYIMFCQKPPKNWIGEKHVSRFLIADGLEVPNPDWRPFVVSVSKKERANGAEPDLDKYLISQSGLQAIFAILGSFYSYLIEDEYAEINPVAQIRQKSKFIRKQQTKRQVRRLSDLQWKCVIDSATEMAEREPDKHERTLFIMSALYGMYLRISELAASERWIPMMRHFHRDSDGNWWFTTVGKGNKERDISVSDAMLSALKRYRAHLKLSPLPAINETIPLIQKDSGFGPITATRQIRRIVQSCFDAAEQKLRKAKLGEEADQLMVATVHWLRHTGISDDVKHRPREHVRDDAGHSSSAITDRYIDIELKARHASARRKKINKEDQ